MIETEENVIVVVRVRPIQKSEESKGERPCVESISNGKEVQVRTGPLAAEVFKCNGCFPRETSQEDFFEQSGITDLLDSAMGGYRASAFAFGQTGAGKTFTCFGPSDDSISPGDPEEGLLGRSLKYLFEKLSDLDVKFNVRISCFEIYHENVFDLFAEEKDRAPLGVREHSTDGFFLVGCKLINCHSYKVACNAVGYAIQNRQVGQHDLNARSTRSHCITEIYIDLPGQAALRSTAGARAPGLRGLQTEMEAGKEYTIMGRMTFVDLAGSERLKTTQSTGKVLHEAGFINRSLYVLGKVIAGLVRTGGDLNHRDVPYRDSKLTKLLISSLGGKTRTLLVACVTEASGSQVETLRTLKFSMSCARIRNRPVRFLDPQVKLILELRGEIKRLRDENDQLRISMLGGLPDSRGTFSPLGTAGGQDDSQNYEDGSYYPDSAAQKSRHGQGRAHSSLRPITQFAHTVAAETADNGSCRKPYPLPGSDRATASRGEGVRESMSRKSQSLVQLRADASAYANRVRTGNDDEEDSSYNRDMSYSRDASSRQRTATADMKKNSPKRSDLGSPSEINPRRKSQTKFVTKVGTLKPVRRTSDVKPSELGMPMSSIREAIMLVKKKRWIESGNKEVDFDGGGTLGSEATSPRADRIVGTDSYRGIDHIPDPERDPNSPRYSQYSSNSPSQSDGYKSHHSPKGQSTLNSRGQSPRGEYTSPSKPAPKRGLNRKTSTSSGYTDDGFDDLDHNDDPDGEGQDLDHEAPSTPPSGTQRERDRNRDRERDTDMDKDRDRDRERERERERDTDSRERDTYRDRDRERERDSERADYRAPEIDYELRDQLRSADLARQEIEKKLEHLRGYERKRQQQKDYEQYIGGLNAQHQKQKRSKLPPQPQYNKFGNLITDKSKNKRVVKCKGVKSVAEARAVIEAQRKNHKKKGPSNTPYVAPLPWDCTPVVIERKFERRVMYMKDKPEEPVRERETDPKVAHLIRDAEMSKLPPQLRPNAQKEREKEREFGSPGQYSSHVGPTASSSSAKTDKTRSEKGKYGDSEYYDVLFEEEAPSERFLPSIRAQAPRTKGETYYQKKDGRKMSDKGKDRGRASGEEKSRFGRQRSNSAESRKVPVFDSESNRAALRVSTSPSPHQHHITKGDISESPLKGAQLKLFKLERKLAEQRQHMEDNPGEVTAQAEELLSAMEAEARAMKADLTLATKLELQTPSKGGRGSGWEEESNEESRGSLNQRGKSDGRIETKKHPATQARSSQPHSKSPQPPNSKPGTRMSSSVSRKDLTPSRLAAQKKSPFGSQKDEEGTSGKFSTDKPSFGENSKFGNSPEHSPSERQSSMPLRPSSPLDVDLKTPRSVKDATDSLQSHDDTTPDHDPNINRASSSSLMQRPYNLPRNSLGLVQPPAAGRDDTASGADSVRAGSKSGPTDTSDEENYGDDDDFAVAETEPRTDDMSLLTTTDDDSKGREITQNADSKKAEMELNKLDDSGSRRGVHDTSTVGYSSLQAAAMETKPEPEIEISNSSKVTQYQPAALSVKAQVPQPVVKKGGMPTLAEMRKRREEEAALAPPAPIVVPAPQAPVFETKKASEDAPYAPSTGYAPSSGYVPSSRDVRKEDAPYVPTSQKRDADAPYVPTSQKRDADAPYVPSSNKRDADAPYVPSSNKRDADAPYVPSSNKRDADAPYVPSSNKRDADAPYVPSSQKRDADAPYVPSSNKRDADAPYVPTSQKRDADAPYAPSTGYAASSWGAKKEDAPYVPSTASSWGVKKEDAPYVPSSSKRDADDAYVPTSQKAPFKVATREEFSLENKKEPATAAAVPVPAKKPSKAALAAASDDYGDDFNLSEEEL